ncbi:MAG TPA: hypothetical protein VK021_10070 [Flavobacteriaceae bacterium]|nr:hypothetical protein [Flavobacteriaceae bacterium]
MTLLRSIIFGLCLIYGLQGLSQTEKINRFDENDKRHGLWKKYFDQTDQLRYEGVFDHGKEIDTFKFYKPNQKSPAAIKIFNSNNDSVAMKFYDHKGRIESEGIIINENREGVWKYYKKGKENQPIMTEEYKNGKLHGWKKTYYSDGQPTEKTHYKHGLRDGESLIYGKNGQVLQQYKYKNDKLHGHSKVYNAKGNILSEGSYKQGLRDGEWKFYTDEKLDSVQKYPLPDPVKKK